MKEKRKYWIILLIGLTTLAIWVNSAVPKTQSAQMSGGLTAWLESTFQLRLTEHLIRKMGHFCEYALLGIEYGFLYRRGRQNGQWLFNFASAGLMTAVLDESIQILSGRGPMVSDVLLDFCGFGFGLILLLLVFLLFQRRNQS